MEAGTSERAADSNSRGGSPPAQFEKSDSLTLPTHDDPVRERSTSQNDYSLKFNGGQDSLAGRSPETSPRLKRKNSFEDDSSKNHFDINQSNRPPLVQSCSEADDYSEMK